MSIWRGRAWTDFFCLPGIFSAHCCSGGTTISLRVGFLGYSRRHGKDREKLKDQATHLLNGVGVTRKVSEIPQNSLGLSSHLPFHWLSSSPLILFCFFLSVHLSHLSPLTGSVNFLPFPFSFQSLWGTGREYILGSRWNKGSWALFNKQLRSQGLSGHNVMLCLSVSSDHKQ